MPVWRAAGPGPTIGPQPWARGQQVDVQTKLRLAWRLLDEVATTVSDATGCGLFPLGLASYVSMHTCFSDVLTPYGLMTPLEVQQVGSFLAGPVSTEMLMAAVQRAYRQPSVSLLQV